MEHIHTYLHLALKLKEKIQIEDFDSFCLGTACSDYKGSWEECKDDFSRGKYFHQLAKEYIQNMDVTKYDAMICDMEVIVPVIEKLKEGTFTGEKLTALENILKLENEPMPLYLVTPDKKQDYEQKLDKIIETFINK